jgi:hypothetical protein
MIHILKRCYRIFLGYFLFVVILLTGIRLFLGQELNVFFTLISGVMIFLYTIFALLVSEQYEEKHHGYSIMSALPVSRLEVTAAKFLLPLASALVLTLYLILIFSTFAAPAPDMVLVRSYFLLAAAAGLLAAGILYIGIFSFGYTKFVVVVLSFTTALGLAPMLVLKGNRGRMDEVITNTLEWIRGLDWFVILPLLLLVYLGLMGVSLQIRAHRSA